MNSKFPLPKLPLLGFEAVVTNLEVCDLIHLSFTSKRLNRLIKLLRLKMNTFMYVVNNSCTGIVFNFQSPEKCVGWIFNHRYHQEINSPVTASIGELELRTYSRYNWLYSCTTGNLQENVRIQLDHFKELIRSPVPDVEIQTDDLTDWKRPLVIGFSEIRNLNIQGNIELKEEVLHEILKSYSVKDSIFMLVPVSTTFTYNLLQWKLPKRIHIKTAHWIPSDFLLRSECSHMMLLECKLTAEDFLQFVERWLTSDDTNFQFLYLHWENGVPQDLNLENLGVELGEFDPKKRSRSFPHIENCAIDMSTGQDFVRKDGVLASIAITEEVVSICVFYERFPNLEGRKVVTP